MCLLKQLYGACEGVVTVYWQTFVTLQFANNNEKILTVVWT